MRTVLTFFGILFSTVLLLAMNSGVIRYREKELAYNLDLISIRQGDGESMGLVSRYMLIKRRMERGAESEADYLAESRLQGVLASIHRTASPEGNPGSGGPAEALVRLYLTGIRAILGKEMIEDVYAVYNDQLMELAYFYERYHNYGKALEVMDNIAKRRKNLDPYTRRTILLHSGFCRAMLSENEAAKENYKNVIGYYPGSREAEAAGILLGYLDAVNKGSDSIMNQDLADNVKAEKLYFLSGYGQSKKLFDRYFKTARKGTGAYARARFYHARAAEESGDRETALDSYRELASAKNTGEWGMKADQRLLMIGTFYREGGMREEPAIPGNIKAGNAGFAGKLKNIQSRTYEESFAAEKAETGYREFVTTNDAGGDIYVPESEEPGTSPIDAALSRRIPSPDRASFREKVEMKAGEELRAPPEGSRKTALIITRDGFRFEGEVIRDDARIIVIRSEFGDIPIGRNQIASISMSAK